MCRGACRRGLALIRHTEGANFSLCAAGLRVATRELDKLAPFNKVAASVSILPRDDIETAIICMLLSIYECVYVCVSVCAWLSV